MQIELIGCTSSGKSSLAKRILQTGQTQGLNILLAEDFVLERVWLNWIKSYLARTLLIDLCALMACVITWRRNLKFYRFTLKIISQLPTTIGRFEKLNIARNTLKKVGVYEIIRRFSSPLQMVLIDEGTLHTAHYLFVHVSVEAKCSDVSTFVDLVPRPDVALYVQQDEAILIKRVLKRGHKRIPSRSPAITERFINRALDIFNNLTQFPPVEQRLLIIDEGQNIFLAQDKHLEPPFDVALHLIRAVVKPA